MMDVKDKTVPRLIQEVVKKNPDAPAQYSKNAQGQFECLTYSQMWRNAIDFAGGLLSYNVQRGERLGLISEDCKEWQQADLGLLAIGAVDIPRGTDASPSDLKYILSFRIYQFSSHTWFSASVSSLSPITYEQYSRLGEK